MKRKPTLTKKQRKAAAWETREKRVGSLKGHIGAKSLDTVRSRLALLVQQCNPTVTRAPCVHHVNLSERYGSQHDFASGRWTIRLGREIRRFHARWMYRKAVA